MGKLGDAMAAAGERARRARPMWAWNDAKSRMLEDEIDDASLLARAADAAERWAVRPLDGAVEAVRDLVWPYNRIRVPTLSRGYADARERILHASFAVLVEYVETEMYEGTDWVAMTDVDGVLGEEQDAVGDASSRAQWRAQHDAIFELYYWWVYERPHRSDTKESVLKGLAHSQIEFMPTVPGTNIIDFGTPRGSKHNPLLDPYRDERRHGWEDAEDQQKLRDLVEVWPLLWD